MEKWKDIEGYTNYMVSNMGRVKSLKFGKEKILKNRKDGSGYFIVDLYKEGKSKTFNAHRLVAQEFISNPNNLPEVNHKDEDKTNNCVDNLEWCNREYNNNYGSRTEKTQKPILQFSKKGEFVRRWNSAMQVQREFGFQQNHISSCCKGKNKSAYGYKWGYADDYERIPFKVFDLEIYKKVS